MGYLQKFSNRHFFQHTDNRRYMAKWLDMKRKRMWGTRIDPDFNTFHYLIWQYTLSRINTELKVIFPDAEFTLQDMELLIYLVHKNRGITSQDIIDFPLGYNAMAVSRQLKKFKALGIVERFEGHGSTHYRGIVYKICKKARMWVSDMNSMQLGYKKIPPDSMICSFYKSRKKQIPNWEKAITLFNEWVDEIQMNINKYKEYE